MSAQYGESENMTLKKMGVKPWILPMPVLMVATYGEKGAVNVMNVGWGGVYGDEKIVLDLAPNRKTLKNMRLTKAFTVSLADRAHMSEADFFGIVSGNADEEKFSRTTLTAVKSETVNAPVIVDFPVTLECEVEEIIEETEDVHVIGRIRSTLVDEKVLGEDGTVDPTKLNVLIYDTFKSGYHVLGERVGTAFSEGKAFLKKN